MSLAADLSKELERAVTAVDASTVLVNGRRRYPASGIALAADLVLTADHVVTRDEDVSIRTASGGPYGAAVAGRDPGSAGSATAKSQTPPIPCSSSWQAKSPGKASRTRPRVLSSGP